MPKYMITNGIKYLRQNQRGDYYLVNEKDATVWSTYKQALNAVNNGISKERRKKFYVEKLGKASDPKTVLVKLIEADTSDFNRWLSSIGNFKRFVNTLKTVKDSLLTELLETEKEICDILHYIEFGRLNACQGWEATEMIKQCRQERRKIKNALYIIDEIEWGRKYGVSDRESTQNAILRMNNRKYTPRKLNFLFEGLVCVQC